MYELIEGKHIPNTGLHGFLLFAFYAVNIEEEIVTNEDPESCFEFCSRVLISAVKHRWQCLRQTIEDGVVNPMVYQAERDGAEPKN